jgi:hypothetical protein
MTCTRLVAGARTRQRARPRVLAVMLLVLAACAPRVQPLAGAPFPERLPETSLPAGHTRLVFRWEYGDPIFGAKGEGVARIAPPDSVRLDFFADGGMGGGFAILIGDRLATPANDDAKRYLPPVPLLWAALGRLQVTGQDTIAVAAGDTIHADIGRSPVWRVTLGTGGLISLQRLESNRLRESITRDSTSISYRNYGARRRLSLTLLRRIADPPFDEAIWHR